MLKTLAPFSQFHHPVPSASLLGPSLDLKSIPDVISLPAAHGCSVSVALCSVLPVEWKHLHRTTLSIACVSLMNTAPMDSPTFQPMCPRAPCNFDAFVHVKFQKRAKARWMKHRSSASFFNYSNSNCWNILGPGIIPAHLY